MNPAESIVVSLEWAKKLESAGWPQEESIYFRDRKADHVALAVLGNDLDRWLERFVAAPTAEEILQRLPDSIGLQCNPNCKAQIVIDRSDRSYRIFYMWMAIEAHVQTGDTLANAAAAMHVYLAEHNLLS